MDDTGIMSLSSSMVGAQTTVKNKKSHDVQASSSGSQAHS